MKRMYVAASFLVLLSSGVLYGNNADHMNVVASSGTNQSINENLRIPVGQYKPQVLFEGQWGPGPEEFGYEEFCEKGENITYAPWRIAVNSIGDIYILDIVNNRIKKYDANGKYVASIEVPSFLTKDKKPFQFSEHNATTHLYYEGMNIALDSQNNLYYCFNRGNSSVIYKYVNDKFNKQWEIPKIYKYSSMEIDLNDNLWIYLLEGIDYNVTKGKKSNRDKAEFIGKNVIVRRDMNKMQSLNEIILNFTDTSSENIIKEIIYKGDGKRLLHGCWPIIKNENVFVWNIWRQNHDISEVFVDLYDQKGNMVANDKISDNKINFLNSPIDVSGNIYQIDGSDEHFKLIKWTK